MTLTQPTSMEELVYFSNRSIDKGTAKAWVYKKTCPKCKQARMGKPVEKGKVKVRATEYVCPACGYTEDKKDHEPTLSVEVIYTCPFCMHKGEATTPYKRKTWNKVPAYVFECGSCKKSIGITKKLKAPKE